MAAPFCVIDGGGLFLVTNTFLQLVLLAEGFGATSLEPEEFIEVVSSIGASSVSTCAQLVPLNESEMLPWIYGDVPHSDREKLISLI